MDTLTPNLDHLKRVVERGKFVILDTETTGLDSRAEIIQIAVIDIDGKGMMDRLIKPTSPIPPDATAIHGITTEEAMKDGSRWEKEFAYLMSGLGNDSANPDDRFDLIIYNASFDTRMITQTCKAHAIDSVRFMLYMRDNPPACAMRAYAEHAGRWNERRGDFGWWKLVDACSAEGIEIENAHDAMGDCLMTLALVNKMIGKANESPKDEETEGKLEPSNS